MTRNRLYLFVLLACFVGFVYLLYQLLNPSDDGIRFCFIKTVTGYACPSCGTTRSVMLLGEGKLADALLMNPFGLIVVLIMVVCPIWITADLVLRKQTFYDWYKKSEKIIRKPPIAVILILLVLANWIWNIQKHL